MPDVLSTAGTILFVDDDADVRRAAELLLARRGFTLLAAGSPEEAWSVLAGTMVDVVLLDLNFRPGATTGAEGFQMLKALLAHDPDAAVVVVTGHSGIAIAVAAMRAGAADFVMKPWNNDRLTATLTEAVALRRRRREDRSHHGPTAECQAAPIVGACPHMVAVRDLASRAATTAASVLIFGEAGTGKTLLARHIHRLSPRAAIPLVTIDPALIWADGPAALSAALDPVPGGATLFLDEIGRLPGALQARLAAFLQARTDLRLLASTRQRRDDTTALPRPDLLDRLNTVELVLPPLRERAGDRRLLAEHFLRLFARSHGRAASLLPDDVAGAIEADAWPGNVRALRQALERAVVLTPNGALRAGDFAPALTLRTEATPSDGGDLTLARSERAIVAAALKRHGFNVSQAARELGLTRAALYRRMARHGL